MALLVIAGGAWGYRWWRNPDRRLGPAPTVQGNECGLGHAPGAVLALDSKTGALKWSRLVGSPDGYRSQPEGLAAADGTVAINTRAGEILAVSAADGSHRWCGRGSVVSAVDERLFTIHGKTIVELDPWSGALHEVKADVLPTLLEAAAADIAVRSELDNPSKGQTQPMTLTATERRTGRVIWSKRTIGDEMVTTSELAIVNNRAGAWFPVPPGSPDHAVATAFDITTGKRVWSVGLPDFGYLHLAGGLLVTEGPGGDDITAIDARTGRVMWQARHPNPGRSVRFASHGELLGVAADTTTGDLFVLVRSDTLNH
ncbi:MAG: PQQ-binding-like beta-propeller repeat protein [Aquihabitans sp.]